MQITLNLPDAHRADLSIPVKITIDDGSIVIEYQKDGQNVCSTMLELHNGTLSSYVWNDKDDNPTKTRLTHISW